MWVENTLSAIGKGVAGMGEKTFERYADAEMSAQALLAMVTELKNRAIDD
jgi:hypothetical protein